LFYRVALDRLRLAIEAHSAHGVDHKARTQVVSEQDCQEPAGKSGQEPQTQIVEPPPSREPESNTLKEQRIHVENKREYTHTTECAITVSLVGSSQVEEIGRLHPYNEHLTGNALPAAHKRAISGAIKRDGYKAVLSGTHNYRNAVQQWPADALMFVMNPTRFYGEEAHYLRDPRVWQRGENGDLSKAEKRQGRDFEHYRNIMGRRRRAARTHGLLDTPVPT
jgi:hypothetical protein